MTIQTTIAVYSFKLNFTLSAQGYLLPTAKFLLPLRLEHSQYRRWPLSTIYNSVFLCTVCMHQHQSHSQTSLHRGSGNETRPIPVSFPDLPPYRKGGSRNETRPTQASLPQCPPHQTRVDCFFTQRINPSLHVQMCYHAYLV